MRTFLLAAALVAAVSSSAAAQETEVTVERIDDNPTFGVGVVAGTTTGATGKIYVIPTAALQMTVGSYNFHDGISGQAEFVWEPAVLVDSPSVRLPFYFGAGTRLSHWQHGDSMQTDLALRVPAGVSCQPKLAPIDVFLEGAFDVNVLSEPTPLRRMALTAALGLRYFF
ncbi:MAG TPA: hypothetical protein VL172_13315 [Kofleriaceae bacterium]|jgi:hypothetical protein|nr:hypothetical protein [Kofleriaceae bacterium]